MVSNVVKKVAIFIAAISIIILVVGYGVFNHQLNQSLTIEKPQLIEIKSGSTIHSFSKQLVTLGLLENRFWLRNYVRINKQYAQLKTGVYQVQPGMTSLSLLVLVNQGKEHQFSVQFIEGTTFKQWLSVLKKQPYIKQKLTDKSIREVAQLLGIRQDNPEGWFYPDTYLYTANTADLAILKRAHTKMKTELNLLWNNRVENLPYNNIYEALIMASIVEKETVVK